MDCRNPVAMDGTYKASNQLIYSVILINTMQYRLVRPCTLDDGLNVLSLSVTGFATPSLTF